MEKEVAEKVYNSTRLLQNIVERYIRPIEDAIKTGEVNQDDAEACLECAKKLLNRISEELYQAVISMAIDPTTGAFTSSALDSFIDRELEICKRNNIPLSVLFIDVDGLKQVNDTYGHRVGDELLKGVVRALKRAIRKADAVFRYGGDEFLVLLHTSEQGAKVVKRRIMQTLSEERITLPEGDMLPSVSIGVAQVDCLSRAGFEEALKKADSDMYEEKKRKKAKENGSF